MSREPDLQGAHRFLSLPSPLAGTPCALVATLYGRLLLDLGEHGASFVYVALGIIAVAVPISDFLAMRRLSTLRALADGDLPRTVEHLQRALREVQRFPDYIFWSGVVVWLGAVVSASTVFTLFVSPMPLSFSLRMVGLGLVFGPLTSLLSHVWVLRRSRQLTLRLVELGLSPSQVVGALPPTRHQLRARLVAFTAIAVICPSFLVADLTITRTSRGLEEVAAVEGQAEQRALAQKRQRETFDATLLLGGLVFAVALATALGVGSAIADPMRAIAVGAKRIAGGKVGQVRVVPAQDEVWAVSSSFMAMHAHLAEVLSQLRRAGLQIGSTTEQIVATSRRYEGGATEQAASLNETSATTEELARSARQIAQNAGSVADIAHRTLGAAEEGQSSAHSFSSSMVRMRQDNEAIADSVLKLNKRVRQIGRIVEFINGVADRSDLLALNAELEGTKAGEVGRGFQLVASEMRRLAENVIESTKEIEGLIDEIREATASAVTATDGGVEATATGMQLAQSLSESLQEIVALASHTSDAVRSISLATQQQQSGTDQLAEAMSEILRVTQDSLGATRQVTTANQDLATLAKDLKGVVERFETEPTAQS